MQGLSISTIQKRILWAALLLVAALASLSSVVNPLWEPPDELEHYQFVRYLIDEKELPVQEADQEISQSHQPPLYYAIGALLVAAIDDPQQLPLRNPFWGYMNDRADRDNKLQFLNPDSQALPYRGTSLVMHLLRLWSVALSLGTVTAMWLTARALWPHEPAKIAVTLAIGALNPMFLYLSGSVNNDNLVIMLGAFVLWLTIRALHDGFARRTTILLGLLWGCALLAKLTGLILAATWGVALAWMAWQRRDARLFVSRLATIVGIALALAGWWFVRNILVYDQVFALGRVLEVWGARSPEQLNLLHLWRDLVYSWTNFWGRFGYGQVPLPPLLYWLCLALSVLAVAGIIKKGVKLLRRPIWLTISATLLAYVAALFYYILKNPTGANGRYVFPALPAMAALTAQGVSACFADARMRRLFQAATIVLMLGLAVFSIALFLPWSYARPRLLSESQALAQVETPREITWGSGIRLLGTTLAPPQISVGEKVALKACWRADEVMTTNYTFYAHLLDSHLNSLGQRDTYTGLGTFPTSFWQRGDIFCDTYMIPLTADLKWPRAADIEIGFYDLDNRQHLQALDTKGIALDRVIVGRIKVTPESSPPAPEMQHRAEARFAQNIVLKGYTWSAAEIQEGETLAVQLAWQASGPLDRSYTVFAHLLDAQGELIVQDDGLPRRGLYPTTLWGAGESIVDERSFDIPPGTPPGPTTLRLGFYLLPDGNRLPREAGADLPDSVELPGPIVINR